MPKTCSQNRKAKLSRIKNKDKGLSTLVVSILPNGDIMVQDYSHQDARKELIRCLHEMGVKTETTLESLCG